MDFQYTSTRKNAPFRRESRCTHSKWKMLKAGQLSSRKCAGSIQWTKQRLNRSPTQDTESGCKSHCLCWWKFQTNPHGNNINAREFPCEFGNKHSLKNKGQDRDPNQLAKSEVEITIKTSDSEEEANLSGNQRKNSEVEAELPKEFQLKMPPSSIHKSLNPHGWRDGVFYTPLHSWSQLGHCQVPNNVSGHYLQTWNLTRVLPCSDAISRDWEFRDPQASVIWNNHLDLQTQKWQVRYANHKSVYGLKNRLQVPGMKHLTS